MRIHAAQTQPSTRWGYTLRWRNSTGQWWLTHGKWDSTRHRRASSYSGRNDRASTFHLSVRRWRRPYTLRPQSYRLNGHRPSETTRQPGPTIRSMPHNIKASAVNGLRSVIPSGLASNGYRDRRDPPQPQTHLHDIGTGLRLWIRLLSPYTSMPTDTAKVLTRQGWSVLRIDSFV
jgi:hypothetical protein